MNEAIGRSDGRGGPGIEVTGGRGGVWLAGPGLWLDPPVARPRAFVSHAHSDHFANHAEILCSRPTLELVRARYGDRRESEGHGDGDGDPREAGRASSARAFNWGERFAAGPGHLAALVPAGHVFGSAMIRVERERDGASLLYTGDFKLREGFSAERAEPVPADTLVMETTFGLPRFRFPPTAETVAALVRFVRGALEDGEVPVLFGYSLGKAQEILGMLAGVGLPVMVHRSVFEMTEVYRRLRGDAGFPAYRLFDAGEVAGHVLVFPPSGARSQAIRRIRNRRTAMLTGWALDPGAKFRYQVDEVFPLSDHADYADLLRTVELVRPARVLTVHGFAAEFARDLRERGVEAWSLLGDDQLELSLRVGAPSRFGASAQGDAAGEPPRPGSGRDGDGRLPSGSWGRFVAVCEEIGEIPGRTGKVERLAAFLAELSAADDDADGAVLRRAVVFLTGRPFERGESGPEAPGEAPGKPRSGWAVVRRALRRSGGLDEQRYRDLSAGVNEPGRTARLVLLEGWSAGRLGEDGWRLWPLGEVEALLRRLGECRGPAAREEALVQAFRALHPAEAAVLVRLLTGDLRIGLGEGLLEEAVAAAFGAPVEAVRTAVMLTGDVGRAALLARAGRLDEAGVTPFVPVKCMLASPAASAEEIRDRLAGGGQGTGPVWLEDKFDGIRVQVHRAGGRVALYSRDLRDVTAEFPELARSAAGAGDDFIADGEIVAAGGDADDQGGRRPGFADLQRRLGRRDEGDLFFGPAVAVRAVLFDLLWRNGRSLIDRPLAERRAELEGLRLPARFERIAVVEAASVDAVESAFKAARARGHEGLVAKDRSSPYRPGRRGRAWLKLKGVLPTLDCVVVRAQRGHGKRSHVLSDYTFAVRDADSGELCVIGKAYSGLTDLEIEELTEHFERRAIARRRHVVDVVPDTVLEIAFERVRPSRRHDSGLALRFPRIVAIRRDKTVDEIDTLETAWRLVDS